MASASATRRLVVALALGAAAGCTRPPAAADAGTAPTPAKAEVVATVNGAPITRYEVLLRLKSVPAPQGMDAAQAQQAALEAIIQDEVVAQRAAALGLENDPGYRAEFARVEAQVAEVRRRQLAKVFLHREILGKAEVSDEAAKRYFDAHTSRFRTRVTVGQVVVKGRAAADAVLAELKGGAHFDDVARARTPNAPAGERPWVLPPLSWAEVPRAWWPALETLQVGQVSGALEGVGERFWVIQLLARTPAEEVTFEQVRPTILATLKAEAIDRRREMVEAELCQAAKVDRMAPDSAPR